MKRNPVLHWFFVMLTGGLYAFMWVYRIAADANRATKSQAVDIRKHITATIILLFAYLWVFIFGVLGFQKQMDAIRFGADMRPVPSPLIFVGFGIGVVLLTHLIFLLIRTATALEKHKGIEIPRKAALVILTLFYFISLPLLQSRINKIDA